MISFNNMKALEIGGPSNPFNSIYPEFAQVDGVNFSANTMWQGQQTEGQGGYRYGSRTGNLYIHDAVDLVSIASQSYDVVLSCHSFEHIANPIRGLTEWIRVLKPNGYILMIVPSESAGDWRRPKTTFEHLVEDYVNNVQEDDLTHWPEMRDLYDLNNDPYAGDPEQFAARCLDNFNNRSMHHHIFTHETLTLLADYVSIKVIELTTTSEGHQVLYQI